MSSNNIRVLLDCFRDSYDVNKLMAYELLASCPADRLPFQVSARTRWRLRARKTALKMLLPFHVIGVCLPSQSAREKHNQEKSPDTFAHLVNFSNVSAMFDFHTVLLFWPYNKQTFRMFSLRDLRLLLSSLDLNVLRAQRIVGLITHRSTRSEYPITRLLQTSSFFVGVKITFVISVNLTKV